MAPFTFLFIALALASHGVFGAPSCSTDLSSCTKKCKAKWHHHAMASHVPSTSPIADVEPTYPVSGTKYDTPTPSPTSPPATQPEPTSTPPASSSPQPASPSPSSSSSSSSSTSSSDIDAYLSGHNTFRSSHGASPLTWSDELATAAQQWASKCVFRHSGGKFGENLAAGTGDFTIQHAIDLWTAEESTYDPNNPTPSHFTQVVWKSSTELGCVTVTCPAGSIFTTSNEPSRYTVCEYNPPGNVIGEFPQNVQA